MDKKQVNSRNLVLDTIYRQTTNKVPRGELVLDDDIIKNNLQSKTVGFDERYEFINKFGLDIISLSPKYSKVEDFSIDCTELDLNKWTKNTSLFTFVLLDGAFEFGLRSIGFAEFLSMIMNDPEETKEFISKVEKLNIETAAKLADYGVDGIIIADDIAFRNGLMLHPESFRELFLPSLENQVKAISERQMIPFFHSDGNYLAVIDDIINSGFKGIHCIDKKCDVTLRALKPYADKICLWGHLDVDDLNLSDDPIVMNRLIKDISDNTEFNGFILGTNSGLFTGMDVNKLNNMYKNVDIINMK
ncbi:hypothetical protein GC105_11700 [Alkalibaculum sp. M08DMB]|uniref:Uroporphyrinogen decarboxylase (URO-D) domain-containing protein n=1 Tax=Alkalibaculum sporogenes TaxID=2655001 RepID=A0A6A7KAN1_9FIRM|nr:uroporphyrinogen decarboxylase family protein [Alkalibaculum sporogenes]MPW26454.1 hypothetical protein [Alkalibaculum sporogenes]